MTGTKIAKASESVMSACFPSKIKKAFNKKRKLTKANKAKLNKRLKKKLKDNLRHSARFEHVYAVTGKQEFQKLFDETVDKLGKGHLDYPKEVVRILQEASDSFLEDVFQESRWWAEYGKRKTVTGKDLLNACGQKAAQGTRKVAPKKRRKC